MDLKEMTSRFWDLYFHGIGQKDARELLSMLDPEACLIGTGAHEVYGSREMFVGDLRNALAEHEELSFTLRKYTCQVVPAGEDWAIVYGNLDIFGAVKGSPATVNMETRYSMVYEKKNGNWTIRHIHHSVPFLEQDTGEYYPRGLYKQLEEVRSLADAMTELARKDSLTGLYNLRTLSQFYEENREDSSWLVLGDLDNFKKVNDVCGHMKGNEVLKQVANLLRSSVRGDDVVARIGGDEFVLLCRRLTRENMEALLARILKGIGSFPFDMPVKMGISMGAVKIFRGESLVNAMRRADQKMYEAKHNGKNQFCIQRDAEERGGVQK